MSAFRFLARAKRVTQAAVASKVNLFAAHADHGDPTPILSSPVDASMATRTWFFGKIPAVLEVRNRLKIVPPIIVSPPILVIDLIRILARHPLPNNAMGIEFLAAYRAHGIPGPSSRKGGLSRKVLVPYSAAGLTRNPAVTKHVRLSREPSQTSRCRVVSEYLSQPILGGERAIRHALSYYRKLVEKSLLKAAQDNTDQLVSLQAWAAAQSKVDVNGGVQ